MISDFKQHVQRQLKILCFLFSGMEKKRHFYIKPTIFQFLQILLLKFEIIRMRIGRQDIRLQNIGFSETSCKSQMISNFLKYLLFSSDRLD